MTINDQTHYDYFVDLEAYLVRIDCNLHLNFAVFTQSLSLIDSFTLQSLKCIHFGFVISL